MAGQKNNSEQKPKLDRIKKALPVEMEEIEIKLDAPVTVPNLPQANAPMEAPAPWQEDLEEMQRVLHQTHDEFEALKKQIQGTEKDTRQEFENLKNAQKEAARQQYQLEAKIAALEKNNAAVQEKPVPDVKQPEAIIAEKTSPPAISKPTISKLAEKPEPQKPVVAAVLQNVPAMAGQKTDLKKLSKVEAQVFTSSQPMPAGFTLQTSLRLSGVEAPLLAGARAPIQVAWYANKVAGNGSLLLKVMMTNLVEKKLEYTLSADIPRLAAGLYQLTTLVTFPTARHIAASCQGPVLQATE